MGADFRPPGAATDSPDNRDYLVANYLAKTVKSETGHAWLINFARLGADKAALISDYDGWRSHVAKSQHETFRWMLEEFRVNVFAQELGTAQPVSVKRLDKAWAQLGT